MIKKIVINPLVASICAALAAPCAFSAEPLIDNAYVAEDGDWNPNGTTFSQDFTASGIRLEGLQPPSQQNQIAVGVESGAPLTVNGDTVIHSTPVPSLNDPEDDPEGTIGLLAGAVANGGKVGHMALNGDSLSYKGFAAIATEESGTDAGNLANAYAGLCLAQTGKYEEAIAYLEKFSGDDQMVAPAVKGALGNCYVHKGDLEKGASLLVAAAKESDSQSLSPIWLQQAGEVYEKLGKKDEALKAYQTIKDKYFNSYNGVNIDKYIERVSK